MSERTHIKYVLDLYKNGELDREDATERLLCPETYAPPAVESVRPEKHTRDMGIYGDDVYYDAKEADLYFDRLEAKLTEVEKERDELKMTVKGLSYKATKFENDKQYNAELCKVFEKERDEARRLLKLNKTLGERQKSDLKAKLTEAQAKGDKLAEACKGIRIDMTVDANAPYTITAIKADELTEALTAWRKGE